MIIYSASASASSNATLNITILKITTQSSWTSISSSMQLLHSLFASPSKPHSFASLPLQSTLCYFVSACQFVHDTFFIGVDVFDNTIETGISNFNSSVYNVFIHTHGTSVYAIDLADKYVHYGCGVVNGKVCNIAVAMAKAIPPMGIDTGIVRTIFSSIIFYSPHIADSTCKIPVGEYSLYIPYAQLSLLVQNTVAGMCFYTTLNIGNNDGLVISNLVYSPFAAKLGSYLYIQFFSNSVAADPSLYNSNTTTIHFQPLLVIGAYYFLRVSIPYLIGYLS